MDTSLAIPRYERPRLAWPDGVVEQRQHILWWVVFVGFAYALAIAYAAYCTYTGGHPDIDLTWYGFKVSCRS
jgi:hypothetical protein